MFVNFYFMPIKYQVFFANIVSIFFNTALSFIHNNNAPVSKNDNKNDHENLIPSYNSVKK